MMPASAPSRFAWASGDLIVTRGVRKADKEKAGKKDFAGVLAGGLIVQAQDTGRVLMIQRTPDKHDDDATFARWEWPGGCLDVDDPGVWAGALREWEEETGSALDESAEHVGSFLDGDGVYQAYVIRVPSESDLEFDIQPEEVADIGWWEPADLTDARVRDKVRDNLAPLQRFLMAPVVKYSDDEPRDDKGEWTSGGGGSGSSDGETGRYGGSGRSWPKSAVDAAENAKAEPSVPAKAWQDPPVPKGKEAEAAPGGGGMTAVGITNTKLGDSVEAAVIGSGLGFTEAHPGIRQGPFDVLHGKDAYEIKAVTTDSTEFKARPSSQAVADKKAFAKEFGLTPHIMIVVYNKDTEAIEMYAKEGVGAYRLSGEEHGWSYLGSTHLGKDTLGLAKALGRSAADVHRHTDAIVAHYSPQIAEAFEGIFPENALSAAIEQARAAGLVAKYSDDQPRDDHGRWTAGGELDASHGDPGRFRAEEFQTASRSPAALRAAKQYAADHVVLDAQTAQPKTFAEMMIGRRLRGSMEAYVSADDGNLAGIMNAALRDGRPLSGLQETVRRGLDEGLAHSATNTDMVVYRGMAASGLHAGDGYTDKGYPSTSLQQATASQFARDAGDSIDEPSQEGMLAEIHLPSGTPAISVTNLMGRNPGKESEIILSRGARFSVDSIEKQDDGIYHAVMTYLGNSVAKYSDDEPRDDRGRWTSGGGGDGGSAGSGGGPGRGSAAERTDASTRMLGELQGSGLTGNDAFNAYATGRLPDTQALNRSADPDTGELRYSADRSELHQQIVDGAVGDHASQERPQALFTAGGPASGKGSLYGGSDVGGMTDAQAGRGEKLAGPSDAVVVDPDRIKMGTAGYQGLPEFKGLGAAGRTDAASAAVHEESSDVAAQVTSAAYEKQANVVVDGVGDSSGDKFAGKIMAAQAAGYDVTLRYAVTDPSTAVDRAIERGAHTGRQLTPEMVTNAHAAVAQTFVRSIQNGVPGVKIEVYDSTSGRQLAASRDGAGKWTIQNPAVYTDFVARGTTSEAAKSEAQGLAVINDSANYDLVTRPAFPYKLRDGTVVDLTDRKKFPLATDHERFTPVPPAA